MKVWDSYIRVYHWLQVGLLGGLWWSAEVGEMEWHLRLASVLGALWISRLFWGVAGSDTARFGHFVKGPATVLAFARGLLTGKGTHSVGHNPLGALMVVALLLVIGVQFGSGLFSSDEIFTDGPLVAMVSGDTVDLFSRLHHLNFAILQGLVVLHVLAVVVHARRGERLVPAMVTGKRPDLQELAVPAPVLRAVWPAWLVLGLATAGLYSWIV